MLSAMLSAQKRASASGSSPTGKDAKDCYLFVGNPGTGKSTIMNGLAKEPVFNAAPSFSGSGVTFQFDTKYIPGVGTLMDTPGLGDETLKHQAAEAITTALKQNGFYRVFFVVTLEEGRIRSGDKATMRLILQAAPISDYSVIVNKVDEGWLAEFNKRPDDQKKWYTTLNAAMPRPTVSVYWMTRREDLASKTNVKYEAPPEVISWIREAPGMHIKSSDVSNIQADELQALTQDMEKMERDFKERTRKWEIEAEEMRAATEAATRRAEQASRDAQEEIRRQKEDSDRRLSELREEMEERAQEADPAYLQQLQEQLQEQVEASNRLEADLELQQRRSSELPGRILSGVCTLGLSELFGNWS